MPFKFLDISTGKMEHHFLKFLEQKTNAHVISTFENYLTPFSSIVRVPEFLVKQKSPQNFDSGQPISRATFC